METSSEKKKGSGWTKLEIFLAVILSCLVCLLIALPAIGRLSQAQLPSETLPKHTVNDYWDNGKGTNFTYTIVADKSLSEEDAKKIISYYENKHPGYKIMNVWIFCDSTYAAVNYVNGVQYADDPYLSHVMYWSMATRLGNAEKSFHSGPDADFPTLRSACR